MKFQKGKSARIINTEGHRFKIDEIVTMENIWHRGKDGYNCLNGRYFQIVMANQLAPIFNLSNKIRIL